jgi:hypothetical protein
MDYSYFISDVFVIRSALGTMMCKSGTEILLEPTAAAISGSPEFAFADSMRVFPPSCSNVLDFEGLLGASEKEMVRRVRDFSEKHVAPVVAEYWEKAEFPFPLVDKFATLGIGGGSIKGYGCQGLSLMSCAMAVVELVRFTFCACVVSCLKLKYWNRVHYADLVGYYNLYDACL